jgi:hypothetical protein
MYFQGPGEIMISRTHKHSRYGYDKGSRVRRLVQAEEIRVVLLRMYQDTRDPDQRPYPGPSPVFADLPVMDDVRY